MNRRKRAEKRKTSDRSEKSAAALQKRFAKAERHLEAGEFGRATPLLLNIQNVMPDLPEVLQALGLIAMKTGKASQAVDYLWRMVQISPDEAESWNKLGIALRAAGRTIDAIRAVERAVAQNPKFADARLYLAYLLSTQGLITRADEQFRLAIAEKPQDFDAHIDYAEFLIKNEALRQAGTVLEHADGMAPEKAHIHYLSGVIYAGLGRLDEALEHLYTVLTLQPGHPNAYKTIGIVLKAAEAASIEFPGLRRDGFERVRSLAPRSPEMDILAYWLDGFSTSPTDGGYRLAMQNIPRPEDEAVTLDRPSGNRRGKTEGLKPPGNLVALLHWGRSGSGFLHSLVDGHPEVSALPGHYLMGFFGRTVWRGISSFRAEEMVERFIDLHQVLFDAATTKAPPDLESVSRFGVNEGYTTMGDNRDQTLTLDRDAFAQNLNALLAGGDRIDRAAFFRFVHMAYEQTLGRDAGHTHIFYHIHSPSNYALLNYLQHFPETKILMTMREPMQNFESWVSTAIEERHAYEGLVERITGFLLTFDMDIFRAFPSRGVRLEDLKFEPAATSAALCRWIGINNHPAMQRPTIQGLKWWGDPSTKRFGRRQPVIGFAEDEFDPDTDPVRRKIGFLLSDRDQFVLKTLLYPVRVLYRYIEADEAKFKSDLKAVRPMLAEPFDFEQRFVDGLILEKPDLARNASSRYLRAVLRDRWETLNANGTYSRMIPPLLAEADPRAG